MNAAVASASAMAVTTQAASTTPAIAAADTTSHFIMFTRSFLVGEQTLQQTRGGSLFQSTKHFRPGSL